MGTDCKTRRFTINDNDRVALLITTHNKQVNAYVNKLSKIDPIQYVVLDMTAVTSVDSSAAHALEEMIQGFKSRAINLAFSNVSGSPAETDSRRDGGLDHLPALR